MPSLKSTIIYGFALFAMFFGSGNLVFPIKIGQLAGQHWCLGFLGLFITGILLPFLGLLVVKFYRGSYNQFFGEGGSFSKTVLPLFTLSLLGSFGVVPRCITVAHAGISYLMPGLSLVLFSVVFCMIVFFFCLKDQRTINVIGKWMSPVLLLSLTILVVCGMFFSPGITQEIKTDPTEVFYNGFTIGYHTMDLFAAFFFSALIFSHIKKLFLEKVEDRELIKFAIKPSIIGMGLLSIVYLGLMFLGAHFSHLLQNVPPELMLATIAGHVMGKAATLLLAIAMLFSCLTTAVALNNIYARHLTSFFKLRDSQFPLILTGTTIISFLISLFDFKGIAAFLGPALEVSYPSIIILRPFNSEVHQGGRKKVK